jgi:hypothetical protein
MNNSEKTTARTNLTRIAGSLYLLIILFGMSSELFVRSSLIVAGDAAATAGNILAAPGLFRLGFLFDVAMLLCDVAIAVVFYLLLRGVGQGLAMTAAALRLIQAALIGAGLLCYYAALLMLQSDGYGASLSGDASQSVAMLLLQMHAHGYDLGLFFFGLSCILLGVLVVRAPRYPGMIGYGLMAAGAVYGVGSFTRFVFPQSVSLVQPLYLVPLVVELAFALWLLLKGPLVDPEYAS